MVDIDKLCAAIIAKDHAKIDTYLEAGADYQQQSKSQMSPLMTACAAQDPTTVRKLLNHGASPNYGSLGVPPLTTTLVNNLIQDDEEKTTPAKQILDLLLEAGADIDKTASTDGSTATMFAIHMEHLSTLLPYKPNLNIQDSTGNTALHHFVDYAINAQEANLLEEYQKVVPQIRMLLDHGACADIANHEKETVASLIQQSQCHELQQLLPKIEQNRQTFNQEAINNRKMISKKQGTRHHIALKRRPKGI